MANKGFVLALLNGLADDVRRVLVPAFEYTLDELSFGYPDPGTKATNFTLYYFTGTTPVVADTEFSVSHGLQTIPSIAIPVMPLDVVGTRFLRLYVTRAADTERVYFASPNGGPETFTVAVGL